MGALTTSTAGRAAAGTRSARDDRLRPYVARLAHRWLADTPEQRTRLVDGTLAFVDVSGFTALTERLAARGKAGAEEVSDIVGGTFAELLAVAYAEGGQMLKWGGDAALLFFADPDSAARGSRAAWRVSRAMERLGRVRTSQGAVRLGVSIGLHHGTVEFHLVGELHRELVVCGPAATTTCKMEAAAESGEVLVSEETAKRLDPAVLGERRAGGVLLVGEPQAPPAPPAEPPPDVDPSPLLSEPVRRRLEAGVEPAEHRHAAIAFIQFRGVDAVAEAAGPDAVADALEPVVTRAQRAAAAHGVTFHYSDIGDDGGKLLLTAGIPEVQGNDEERLLRAALEVVHGSAGPLALRAGLNAGRFFVHDAGDQRRRVYSFSGDAINLGARVMGHAGDGEVLVTDGFLARVKGAYRTTAVPPFTVKGKTAPVAASVVAGPADPTPADAGVPPSEAAFVGRQAELDALLDAAGRAAAGSGRAVEVVAAAGLGKSRLLAEAAARWDLPTRRVVGDEYGGATPYLPFRHLLRALLDGPDVVVALAAAVSARAPHLEPWLPLLAGLLGAELPATPEVERLEPRFRPARLADATVGLLDALVPEPAALVFEDVHAVDEASQALLRHLVVAAERRPWLLVVTRRPAGATPLPDGPPEPHRRLELAPLAAADALALVAAGAPVGRRLPPHERQRLVERAGGNPLFLVELSAAVRADQPVDSLPDDLEVLLAAQIDRLAPADRQLLRAASVFGVWFDTALLEAVAGEPGGAGAVWERLGGLVVREGEATGRFSHALVRDAAYEGLSYRRRRELHHRAALAIAAAAPDPDAEAAALSLHFLQADRHEEAWRWSKVAGARAAAVYANAEAATCYRRALQAARHLRAVDAGERAAVAEALGDADSLAGDFDEAVAAYAEARRLDPPARPRLLRKAGFVHERSGRFAAALACYTRARKLVAGGPAQPEGCEAAVAAAGVRFRQGRFGTCLRLADQAAAEALACGHRAGLAHALYLQDNARSALGQGEDGTLEQALAIYEELGDLVGQGNVLNNLGVNAYFRGRWAEAADLYGRGAEALRRAGDVVGAAMVDNNIAEILSDQGRLDEARALFESAREAWQATGYEGGLALVTSNLGRLAARAGDAAAAAELLAEARRRFAELGAAVSELETEARQVEAQLLVGAGTGWPDVLEGMLRRVRTLGGADVLEPALLRLLGQARAAAGDRPGALGALDDAVERAEAQGADYEVALSLAARAEAAGGGDGARRDARAAARRFTALGVAAVPVSSAQDLWPDGPRARALTGRG